jgi:predicted amidophosphoribosyltransferase
MKKATDLMTADTGMASGWAEALSGVRDKPLKRCQNCTKTAEEIGGNPKFMTCSACKSKLDFAVHYCSQ